MKKYKNDGLLVFFTIVFILLTIVFFYFLNKVKLWTFNSYTVTSINSDEVMVVVNDNNINLFRENSFFYYNTKKYYYEILRKTTRITYRRAFKASGHRRQDCAASCVSHTFTDR